MAQTQQEKAAYLRQWRLDNADHVRERYGPGSGYYRKYHTARYGMTPDEYDAFLEQPCAICGGEAEVVDHDHATGEVRGPLCGNCNKSLGLMRDDPDRLVSAAAYLLSVQKGGE